jgi:hypothetical protein
MLQYAALPALPSVGPVLGAAYDRAVMVLVRSWRVVAIFVALDVAVAIVPSLALNNVEGALIFSWAFYAMANAIRAVFDPEYRMTNRTAGGYFGALLSIGVIVVALNFMAGVALAVPPGNVLAWLLAAPGIIAGIWLYVRWSCGPVLGAQGVPVMKALSQSWRLTSLAFWPTVGIWGVNVVIAFALPWAIRVAAFFLINQSLPVFPAVAVTIVATVLEFIASIYVTQARAVATCMWLAALRQVQPAEVAEGGS